MTQIFVGQPLRQGRTARRRAWPECTPPGSCRCRTNATMASMNAMASVDIEVRSKGETGRWRVAPPSLEQGLFNGPRGSLYFQGSLFKACPGWPARYRKAPLRSAESHLTVRRRPSSALGPAWWVVASLGLQNEELRQRPRVHCQVAESGDNSPHSFTL